MVFRDVQSQYDQGKVLSVGAFVGGELYLSRMHFFPSPLLPLFFLLLLFFLFYFKV
jgi:hypothetical protein